MTKEQLKRAREIEKELKVCNNILGFQRNANVEFCHNFCGFMKKELFDVVKKKKADLEHEFENL